MNSKSDWGSGRPDQLTLEQRARYDALAEGMSPAEVEAEIREILAHPESWVSAEKILQLVREKCGTGDGKM